MNNSVKIRRIQIYKHEFCTITHMKSLSKASTLTQLVDM